MMTKWYHYLLAFLSGAFYINVVPHFVSGVTGTAFPSPFATPPGVGLSTPVENILWALINFSLAFGVQFTGKLNQCSRRVYIAFFIGAVMMSFYLASYFSRLDLAHG